MPASGARIELSENVVIPDVIELYIPKKEETHHARVRWRRNNEVGVAYVENGNGRDHDRGVGNPEGTAEEEHKGIGLEDRMQRLEAEMASLAPGTTAPSRLAVEAEEISRASDRFGYCCGASRPGKVGGRRLPPSG